MTRSQKHDEKCARTVAQSTCASWPTHPDLRHSRTPSAHAEFYAVTQSGALSLCTVCFADSPAPGPRLSTAVAQCLQTHQPVETRTGRACQTACVRAVGAVRCALTSRTTTGASPLFNFTAFSAMACLNPTSAISAPSLVCDAKEWRQTHKTTRRLYP
jgi:hypothetical protein